MRPPGTSAYIGAQCTDTLDMANTATNADKTIVIQYPTFTNTGALFANPSLPLIYLGDTTYGNIYIYDETQQAITTVFNVQGGAFCYASNPSGTDLFIGSVSGYVYEVNTATNQVVAKVRVGNYYITGMALNPATNLLYAADSNGNRVGIINTANMAIVGSIPVGNDPTSVTLTPRVQPVIRRTTPTARSASLVYSRTP